MAVSHRVLQLALLSIIVADGRGSPCCRGVVFGDHAHGYAQNSNSSRNWLLAKDSPLPHRPSGKDYTFLSFRYPFSADDSGSLISPVYELPLVQTHHPCTLTFVYFLDGEDNVTSLSLFLHTSNGQKESVWNEDVSSSQWRVGRVSIHVRQLRLKLEFHGVCGEGCNHLVNIALANLTSSCCLNQVHGAKMRSCSMVTFDDGLDGFRQSSDDNVDWWRHYGPSPSYGTGPSADHSTEYGAYMYLEATPYQLNQTALLLSPNLKRPAGDSCRLSFWYHMRGRVGTLAVFIITLSSSLNDKSPVWFRTGRQGIQWRQALLGLGHINSDFQIAFKAICGKSGRGDIAIDDVKLSSSCCQATTTPTHNTGQEPSMNTGTVTTAYLPTEVYSKALTTQGYLPTEVYSKALTTRGANTSVYSKMRTTLTTISLQQNVTVPSSCQHKHCLVRTMESRASGSSSGPSLTEIVLYAFIVLAAFLILIIVCILCKLRRLRSDANTQTNVRHRSTHCRDMPMVVGADRGSNDSKSQTNYSIDWSQCQVSGVTEVEEDDLSLLQGVINFDNPMFSPPQDADQMQSKNEVCGKQLSA